MDIRWLGWLWVVFGLGACGAGPDESGSAAAGGNEPLEADAASSSGTPLDASGSPRIVFLGTSLTAGFGLEDPGDAYPAVIEARLRESDLRYEVSNAGVSGDTSAGGLARLGSILQDSLAVLVVELGANDGLRGQSVEALRRNLEAIAAQTRAAYPNASIVLAGMEAPPNLGPEYTAAFRAVYADLAEEKGLALVPFLLDGVAGERAMNQDDGIHPNVEGHGLVAESVWDVLEGVLRTRCEGDGACQPA